nr:hypothetical protein [Enterococcus faecalis]
MISRNETTCIISDVPSK